MIVTGYITLDQWSNTMPFSMASICSRLHPCPTLGPHAVCAQMVDTCTLAFSAFCHFDLYFPYKIQNTVRVRNTLQRILKCNLQIVKKHGGQVLDFTIPNMLKNSLRKPCGFCLYMQRAQCRTVGSNTAYRQIIRS